MRILIANNVQIIVKNYGGYGKQLHYLIRLFSERGDDLYYYTSKCKIDNGEPFNRPYSYEEMAQRYTMNDIKFLRTKELEQMTFFSAQQDELNEVNVDHVNTIIREQGIDLFFFLGDVFVFYVSKEKQFDVPSYCWFPCHYFPFSEYDLMGLAVFDNIICLSPSVKGLLEEEFPSKNVFYLPHISEPVNVQLTKAQLRNKWGIDKGRFIVTIVSQIAFTDVCNRKAIDVQLIAFAEFNKKHPHAFLFLHTTSRIEDRVIVSDLVQQLKLTDTNFYWNDNKILSEESLAELYILSDVVLNCSKAEGFGVPILEAQQYGTHVITNNFLSMAEHNFQNNIVPMSTVSNHYSLNGIWSIPSSAHIVKKLKELYFGRNQESLKRAKRISTQLSSYETVKRHLFKIIEDGEEPSFDHKKLELKHKYFATSEGIVFIHIIDNNYNCIDKILLGVSSALCGKKFKVVLYYPIKIRKSVMISELIPEGNVLNYVYQGSRYSFPMPSHYDTLSGDFIVEINFTINGIEDPVYNLEHYQKLFSPEIHYEIIDTQFDTNLALNEHIFLSDIYIPVSNTFSDLSILSQSYKTYTLFLSDDEEKCLYGKNVSAGCNDLYYDMERKTIETVLRVDDIISAINEYCNHMNDPIFNHKKEMTYVLYFDHRTLAS